MALRSLNIISLCTGGGGLDRAVELAAPSARPVLCVEREAFAVANLVAQMQNGVMAPAPVWSDVRTVPGRRFRGGVDGVIGGIPCQPYSLAGKRLGREDERDLWGPARRIFVQSGAWFILIENVGGMLSEGGAERVRGDLLRLGCQVEGGLFRASEVGFPHERERLFILGVADPESRPGWREQQSRGAWGGRAGSAGVGPDLADAGDAGLQGRERSGPPRERDRAPAPRSAAELRGAPVADPDFSFVRGQSPAGQQPVLQRDDGDGGEPAPLAHTDRTGPAAVAGDAGEVGGLSEAERQPEHGPAVFGGGGRPMDDAAGCDRRLHPRPGSEGRGTADAGGTGQVVDPLSGGRDGRPCEPIWAEEERAAVEWASGGPLFAPGPGDVDAWAWIAEHAPERLPALSRRDLFFHEVRKAHLAAARDPAAREGLDPKGPYGLRPSVVQAIAQSALRRGSDGLAPRIDQLRMLGNGVVDLAGAYALRTLATDLARRSAGAAELVRMMEQPAPANDTPAKDQAA